MRKMKQLSERYARHFSLPGIGPSGQEKLSRARVLIIGAGGLGCPASLYLTAAGVGTLGLAEFDRVDLGNLQRQVLYRDEDVGSTKLEVAERELTARNPAMRFLRHPEGITTENALELLSSYDLVLDGSDNFGTRYLVNDAAVLAGVPLISASLFQYEGQLAIYSPKDGGPCYRCLFSDMPAPGEVPNCAEAGVLGALCGVVGSLQALEAVKWITGVGDSLLGSLLTVDAWSQRHRRFRITRNPDCAVCGEAPSITRLEPECYAFTCPTAEAGEEMLPADAAKADSAVWLDVREEYEREICAILPSLHIPLGELPRRLDEVNTEAPVIVYCHHGVRSLQAVRTLRKAGRDNVRNLIGGIDRWAEERDPELTRY
jgi:adenylyltransferase/sulfurtransferase